MRPGRSGEESSLLSAANPDRRRKQKGLTLSPLPAKPKSLVPADFIRNPMMFEFLSLPQDVQIRETKLESAILSHLKDVLMEMGRGFSFVAPICVGLGEQSSLRFPVPRIFMSQTERSSTGARGFAETDFSCRRVKAVASVHII